MYGSDSCGIMGVSLSRSEDVARFFAQAQSKNRSQGVQDEHDWGSDLSNLGVAEVCQWITDPKNGGGGAVLSLDWVGLSRTYELRQVDELGDGSEQEERLVGDGVKGIVDFIAKVEILNPEKFVEFCQVLIEKDSSYRPAIQAIKNIATCEMPGIERVLRRTPSPR